jgi:excisionase family DNA binding protein
VSAPSVNGHLVDASAAADLLGVPRTWVLAEARANRIPHVRLGRYVRFEPGELQTWWRARRRGPVARERQTAA